MFSIMHKLSRRARVILGSLFLIMNGLSPPWERMRAIRDFLKQFSMINLGMIQCLLELYWHARLLRVVSGQSKSKNGGECVPSKRRWCGEAPVHHYNQNAYVQFVPCPCTCTNVNFRGA